MSARAFAANNRSGVSTTSVVVALVVTAAIAVAVYSALRTKTTGKAGNRLGKEFQADVSSVRRIDPNLFRYEQAGQFETGSDRVYAIAVGPDDGIYVAGDRAIRVFDRGGKQVGRTDTAGEVRCLAVAADGTIYAGARDRVQVYAQGKAPAKSWEALGGKAIVTGIAVAGDDVFVAVVGPRTGAVLRYEAPGKLLGRIGPKDANGNVTSFLIPSAYFDVAVAPDGLLRVAHTGKRNIEAYTFDGDREFAWGQSCAGIEGFSGCCNPAHIAVLPDGSIVTSEKGLLRCVKVYHPDGPDDAEGKLEGVVLAGRPEKPGPAWDVATDSGGRILVLDRQRRTVRIFVRKESK